MFMFTSFSQRLPSARKVRESKTLDTHLDLLLESAVVKLETSVKKMETFARAADVMALGLQVTFSRDVCSNVCAN